MGIANKLKNNKRIYYRHHITLRPEIYKIFTKAKGRTMARTGDNLSDSKFIELLLKRWGK